MPIPQKSGLKHEGDTSESDHKARTVDQRGTTSGQHKVVSDAAITNPGEEKELEQLLRFLSLVSSKQPWREASNLDPASQRPAAQHDSDAREAVALEQFSLKYQNERHFSQHKYHQYFSKIFSALVKERLSSVAWTDHSPSENVLRVLVCCRIMMRDSSYQIDFFHLGGVKVLARHLDKATESYLMYGDGPYIVDILKEMTNIFQKVSAVVQQREWLVACGVHKALVLLLSANDVLVLHCTLHALISLAQSAEPRKLIAELNSVETLLRILQDYDILSKKLAAHLLRLLCADPQAREMIKVFDGIPLLLSLLHCDNIKVLWNVVWCLVQLSEDQDLSNDIRQMGGIPLLITLLHDRKFVSDRSSSTSAPGSAGSQGRQACTSLDEVEETKEHILSLKSACCAALTELVLNDTNAQQMVQGNGIYSLGVLILPQDSTSDKHRKAVETLQGNAFRALRFLFSMERNRRLFKRIFPAEMFEMFIDIGHYNRDISAYKALVQKINTLPAEKLKEIEEKILETNLNKAATHFIKDYAVLELLGSGAFGCVYKVKKTAGQSFLAMKEINALNPSFGKTARERDKSIGAIISELTIIKEQMRHPNVVRYYKTFVENDKLYIVMELIEGAPLGEHFNSLKEKGEKFPEARIWHIFIQLVLALRYLHKEKGIVHRDLTPNNIMLGENDKVTITDFGLAKQKQKDSSKMTSVVGTFLYSCPEVVKNQPYGEKSDIWAMGCVLYQMCMLEPPFYSNSMLSLATKIVEADYTPVTEGLYSEKLISTVKRCITVSPEDRPDIVEVAAHISDVMLAHLDQLQLTQISLEKKLDRERKRTQRHFTEAYKNKQNYHRLFLASQERYDKLVNLASSGGAQSIKEGDLSDSVFSDHEMTESQIARSDSVSTETGPEVQVPTYKGELWLSDEEAFSSSSGSNSRESSAGSVTAAMSTPAHTLNLGTPPRPPHHDTPRRSRRKIKPTENTQSLSVDTKLSRDSGFSSGDPSPNNSSPPSVNNSYDGRGRGGMSQRSASSPGVERRKGSSSKSRPNSATVGTLTISQRKVREINDPILQILNLLHKIIYITQLPPTLCHNPRRLVIERFKRALFAQHSSSTNLKTELKKLLIGSREVIDINLNLNKSTLLNRQASLEVESLVSNLQIKAGKGCDIDAVSDGEMTYEQMQTMIESVLVESGYYDVSPALQSKTETFPQILNSGDTASSKPS